MSQRPALVPSLISFCLLLPACSRTENEPAPKSKAVHAALFATTTTDRVDRQQTAPEPQPAPVFYSQALARIPRDAVAVIRVADWNGQGERWRKLALARALQHLDLDALLGAIHQGAGLLRSEMMQNLPHGEQIFESLSHLRGEVAIGLVRLIPKLFDQNHEMPFSLVAYVALGEQAEPARRLLCGLFAPQRGPALPPESDRFQQQADGVRLDLWVHDGWLAVQAQPESATSDQLGEWADLELQESFLSSPVVLNAPAVVDGEQVWADAYLNLQPIIKVARELAPPEVTQMISSLGLDRLRGVSARSSLSGEIFHDTVMLQSKAASESGCAETVCQTIDQRWARHVPADADGAVLWNFDLGAALGCLRESAPPELKSGIDSALAEFRSQTDLDLEQDLLALFGSHQVLSHRGEIFSALAEDGEFEAALSVEVRQTERLATLMDRLFADGGLPLGRIPHQVGDQRYHSIHLPLPDVPAWLEPSFGFVDDALVLATSPDMFRRVAKGASQPEQSSPPAWISETLARAVPGTFAVYNHSLEIQMLGLGQALRPILAQARQELLDLPIPSDQQLAAFAADLPRSQALWQGGPEGFRFDNHSAISTPWLGAAPIAIIAAIAIPNLLSSRLSANEQAAMANLRNLASAETQFQATGLEDQDQDNQGEYGTLSQLVNTDPPLLSQAFAAPPGQSVSKNGYNFQIYLPGPQQGLSVSDAAERHFVAYAWPKEIGSTGRRVFYIDQRGSLFYSSNDGPGQVYSAERAPAAVAAYPDQGRQAAAFDPDAYFASDGGFWLRQF